MKRHICFRITQSRAFLSNVCCIEGTGDKGTRNLVRSNESSLYRGFFIQRAFTCNLPARSQGTGLPVRNSGKFVIRGVRKSGIPLYLLTGLLSPYKEILKPYLFIRPDLREGFVFPNVDRITRWKIVYDMAPSFF